MSCPPRRPIGVLSPRRQRDACAKSIAGRSRGSPNAPALPPMPQPGFRWWRRSAIFWSKANHCSKYTRAAPNSSKPPPNTRCPARRSSLSASDGPCYLDVDYDSRMPSAFARLDQQAVIGNRLELLDQEMTAGIEWLAGKPGVKPAFAFVNLRLAPDKSLGQEQVDGRRQQIVHQVRIGGGLHRQHTLLQWPHATRLDHQMGHGDQRQGEQIGARMRVDLHASIAGVLEFAKAALRSGNGVHPAIILVARPRAGERSSARPDSGLAGGKTAG